ncbi:MAG: hypothetical protein ACRD2J_11110 [Thermoanaerobaculia bacterium]
MSATTPEGRGGIGVTHATEETARRMKDTAREKTTQMRKKAREKAGEQKDRATGEIGALASALHDAGRRLDEEQHPSGRLINRTADRLEDVAHAIENRSVDELMREASGWARRSPGLLLGGAIAVGFLASRFLKADRGHDIQRWEEGPYGTEFATPEYPPSPESLPTNPPGGPYGRS